MILCCWYCSCVLCKRYSLLTVSKLVYNGNVYHQSLLLVRMDFYEVLLNHEVDLLLRLGFGVCQSVCEFVTFILTFLPMYFLHSPELRPEACRESFRI